MKPTRHSSRNKVQTQPFTQCLPVCARTVRLCNGIFVRQIFTTPYHWRSLRTEIQVLPAASYSRLHTSCPGEAELLGLAALSCCPLYSKFLLIFSESLQHGSYILSHVGSFRTFLLCESFFSFCDVTFPLLIHIESPIQAVVLFATASVVSLACLLPHAEDKSVNDKLVVPGLRCGIHSGGIGQHPSGDLKHSKGDTYITFLRQYLSTIFLEKDLF